MSLDSRIALHICPLCEATCGMQIVVEGDRIVQVRGDDDDVFSRGFQCPKGIALGELHHDPHRLRTPMVRDGGTLRPASWEEALARIDESMGSIVREHGPDAVAVYLGNPNVHNASSTFYIPALIRALGTSYRFSASTVDQMPKQVASALVFGTELSVPVPDVDRTDLYVVLGANPLVSNGSLMTAPDMPGRLRALRNRGGRLVVIDPVRTQTARAADRYLPIRPGTDAVLLAAIARRLLEADPDLGAASGLVAAADIDTLRAALAPFDIETAARATGIAAMDIEQLAEEIRQAPSMALYARMGTTTAAWWPGSGEPVACASVASWLVDVISVISGNIDRPGGSMWPLPAAGGPTTDGESGRGRGIRIPGSRRTRVRGLPSVLGEFPAVCMAEEIDTPDPLTGERVRAMLVVGGNPVVSTPDAVRLEKAMSSLDFLVCVDAYLTETSAGADVVLPVPSPLERPHYDLVFANLAVANSARYSSAVVEPDGVPQEGTTLLTLSAMAAGWAGADPAPTPEQLDDLVAWEVARRIAQTPSSPLAGRDPAEILALVGDRRGVERLIDISLRGGPYGLTLDDLLAQPHGIDLGPLQPRLPDVLRTPSGLIDLAPEVLVNELDALGRALLAATAAGTSDELLLVGRRQLRTNNSWLRNLPLLSGGSAQCTLRMSSMDAKARGISDGASVVVSRDGRSVSVCAEISDDVMVGVVSLPHGWASPDSRAWGPVARERGGANVNVLTPASVVDPLAGTAVLNGVPVLVRPA